MLTSLWLLWPPIVVSSVALFFASFLSWMVVPIHRKDWVKLEKEDDFMKAAGELGIPCVANHQFAGFLRALPIWVVCAVLDRRRSCQLRLLHSTSCLRSWQLRLRLVAAERGRAGYLSVLCGLSFRHLSNANQSQGDANGNPFPICRSEDDRRVEHHKRKNHVGRPKQAS